ncbi:MAG: phosphotransferase [Myxococcota bacterium]
MRVPDLPLYDEPQAIPTDWVAAVLRHAGFDVELRGFTYTPVGTGQMADNYRLQLDYAAAVPGAPTTLVVKVPASNPTSRQSGASGAYLTEVNFYQQLASQLAIRTPRCLHADISPENDGFVLVLEDLAPCEQGDQIRGASVAEAEIALRNLAGLHAPSWAGGALENADWVGSASPEVAAMMSQILIASTETFIERYADRMHPDDAPVLRRFAAGCERWLLDSPGRRALVHGDYRLDNLLFATDAGGAPVATVDWQTVAWGSPGRDVAYFLGNSFPPELRRTHEGALLAAYRDELAKLGVGGYDADACLEDYRHGLFQGPLVTVLGSIAVEPTERGNDMFMAMCSRACQAIRDHESDALLA